TPRGTYCLQLSTDKVFDGTVALRARGDAPCPLTAYGRQKAAAEQAVLRAGGGVLRLSKVLAPDLDLVQDWRRKLLTGAPVTPFHDLRLAPVTVDFAVDLIRRLLDDRAAGIHHCSGAEDRPYVALAEALAKAIGAPANLIRPISAGPLFPPAQRVPHTTLEMDAENRRYGLANPGFDTTVGAVLRG
ncbi:MAG TPA: sugar nucleotide-binding protein, partial [Candidatus Sulfotelmatobacter sp.]|nr:sugar nucleotide-binding protein [Candidatus Sulfotelmatobacter sp.]